MQRVGRGTADPGGTRGTTGDTGTLGAATGDAKDPENTKGRIPNLSTYHPFDLFGCLFMFFSLLTVVGYCFSSPLC